VSKSDISAADLANTLTAFATILSGVVPLCLTLLTKQQPVRWIWVYTGIIVTGIATVWNHGFGEEFWPGIADGGINLLLAWLLQVAVLWDYYSPRVRWPVSIISALINGAVVIWRILYGPGFISLYVFSFGAFGGFHPLEVTLILDSILGFALLYIRFPKIPAAARPLLYLLTIIFFIAAMFASAGNQKVDFHMLAYHAIWHTVSAFGFIVLWAFNRERFG